MNKAVYLLIVWSSLYFLFCEWLISFLRGVVLPYFCVDL